MKVVVLTGPESSGKSWLAAQLQAHFGGLRVDEYVRHFMEQTQRDTCLADITDIATGQLAWEDAARARQPELLVLDTHLLSNILWSQTLFDDCPAWLEPALLARHYDVHLLLSPEQVEWTGDGLRCQPALEERMQFFEALKDWLVRHQQPLQVIEGDWAQRRDQVFAAVTHLLRS
ncbi:N-acetylglucosamine-6-sulfatase [Pseudomonas brassicacearum]|uniref:AAA family ATPase n=1 Tax=Pseudomonas brassicacearum TaxID=930166 RepID=UPI000F49037D|nr:AAA family ATPase [Pseudomonas brassicacearum]ROM72210.1 N-acetylglucosamine-6-sulfatase [Pseudomonas brassicacearum]